MKMHHLFFYMNDIEVHLQKVAQAHTQTHLCLENLWS